MRPTFFHHLHPPTIPKPQARLRFTLAAGGVSFFLLFMVIITGALQLFHYAPDTQKAALSIQEITYLVPFGWLVRGLHFWSAQLLVLAASLHLLRVVFTGAYGLPRRLNYLIGMGLLLLVVWLDFSGYVLRWDQGVQWLLVNGTDLVRTIPVTGEQLYALLVGGKEIGAATITRFYTWHVFGLSLLAVILAVWHIFRVRRDGGIAVPPAELREDQSRITRNELVSREAVAAMLVLASLIVLGILFPASIAAPIKDAGTFLQTANSPWFFMWVRQLLKLGNPFIFGIAVPLGLFLLLTLIPFIFKAPKPEELGRWLPASGKPARWLLAAVLAVVLLLSLIGLIPSP